MEEIFIETDFIKLDQLLKFSSVVQTGSEAKFLISEGFVFVNGEVETRRGRKIYDKMIIDVNLDEKISFIVKKR